MFDESIGTIERRRNAKLKKLAGIGPVLQGTITTIGVKCGNPNCKCARGEKHESNVLTRKVDGKTKSVYVPKAMLEEARRWTDEYASAKKLLKEISECDERILRLHVRSSGGKKRDREEKEAKVPSR